MVVAETDQHAEEDPLGTQQLLHALELALALALQPGSAVHEGGQWLYLDSHTRDVPLAVRLNEEVFEHGRELRQQLFGVLAPLVNVFEVAVQLLQRLVGGFLRQDGA